MGNEDDPLSDGLSTTEAIRRVYDRVTYTTPLPAMTEVRTVPLSSANNDDQVTEIGAEEMELERFLERFCVREKTEEIVEIMKSTPRLKQLFEELVPTVTSYPDFWTRFYFRCDPDRIRRLSIIAGDEKIHCEEGSHELSCYQSESSTPTIPSPSSVAEHYEFDNLDVLRTFSLAGL